MDFRDLPAVLADQLMGAALRNSRNPGSLAKLARARAFARCSLQLMRVPGKTFRSLGNVLTFLLGRRLWFRNLDLLGHD